MKSQIQISSDQIKREQHEDEDDVPLLPKSQNRQTPIQQFLRQKQMAIECCDLGRKYLHQKDYQNACKEFSKTVMTFQYILQTNLKQQELKGEIKEFLQNIIMPAYSNLALCYLKMANYEMVLTFTNNVLQNDSSNVKNLMRRGTANKMLKNFDEAINDFQMIMNLDETLKGSCEKEILDSKKLRAQEKQKQKMLSQKILKGYSKNMPEPVPFPVSVPEQEIKASNEQSKDKVPDSIWKKAKNLMRRSCSWLTKYFKRN